MLVIPISSAQCERGFSAQRRIKSDVRRSLHVSTKEDLILSVWKGQNYKLLTQLQQLSSGLAAVRDQGVPTLLTEGGQMN